MSYPPPPSTPPVAGFDIGTAFSWSWQKFREHWVPLVVGALTMGIVDIVFQVPGQAGSFIVDATTGDFNPDTGNFDGANTALSAGVELVGVALVIVGSSISFMFCLNFLRMIVTIADGGRPQVADIFAFRNVGQGLLLWLLLCVGSLLGICACIIGIFVFGFFTTLATYALADDTPDAVAAIKTSCQIVWRNLATFLLVALCVIAMYLVGFMACCVGLLVASPLANLFITYAYRWHTGKPIAA